MFLSLLGALKELADGNTEELGEQFSSALLEATDSARTKLHAMQAESPNTFKAAHTLLAFRHAVAEFYHKLHTYQDQGFFDAKLVEEVEFALEGRQRELEQYLTLDTGAMLLGLLSCNFCIKDHPIVGTYALDQGTKAGVEEEEVEDNLGGD
jgi:hypothetical protein